MPNLRATSILQDLKELSNFTDGEINKITSDTGSELEDEWLSLIKKAVSSIANRSSKKKSCEKEVDRCSTHGVPDIIQFFNRKSNVKASIFLQSEVERVHVHKDKNVRFFETDNLTESKTKGPIIGNHCGSSPIQIEAKTVHLSSNIQEISGPCNKTENRTYLSGTKAPVTNKDENAIVELQSKNKKVSNAVIYGTPSKSSCSNSTIGCFTQVLDKKFKNVCVPNIAITAPTILDGNSSGSSSIKSLKTLNKTVIVEENSSGYSSMKSVKALNETVIVKGNSRGSSVTKNGKLGNETVILEGHSCGSSVKNVEGLSSKDSCKIVSSKQMDETFFVKNASEAKSLKNTSRFYNTPVVSLLASRKDVAPSLGLTSMLLKSSVQPIKKEKDKMKEIKIKEDKVEENRKKQKTARQQKLEEGRRKRQERAERTAENRLRLENEKREKHARQVSGHEISLSVKKEPVVKKGRKRKSDESQDEKVSKKCKRNEDEENAIAHCKPATMTLNENKPSRHVQKLNERNCAESNSGKIKKAKSEKEKSVEICSNSNGTSLPKKKPAVQSGEERKVALAIKTPQSASVKTEVLDKESCAPPKTPKAKPKRNTPEVAKTPIRKAEDEIVSYDMTPIPENESSDEENERARAHKKIPSWAQGVLLKTALINQHYYPLDIDELFGMVIECPDLSKIFDQKKKHYSKRTSSAIWHSPPCVET